ncbi:DUF7344 domain-containing protein [Halostella pelagica]|uniref:DUF7344 domain-containing protein n=1 Tax=Halostella pelagica TaxID=2583824 RepID=UPI00107FEACA|nr:hypothetical protein [Halostella pelagica]
MNQKPVKEGDSGTETEETDVLFSILSRERRRYALYCLKQYRNPLTLADLADEVARIEHDEQNLAQIPGSAVKSIYMDLYHSHVPKMDDAGVVEYSQSDDTVRLKYEFTDLDLEEFA